MEHSPPGESIRSSPSQEISRIIRNRHVQYHGHQSTPPVPVLSQIKPGHPTQYFLNIYLHTTYPSKPKSFKWSLFLWFPHQNSLNTFHLSLSVIHRAYFILIDSTTQTRVN